MTAEVCEHFAIVIRAKAGIKATVRVVTREREVADEAAAGGLAADQYAAIRSDEQRRCQIKTAEVGGHFAVVVRAEAGIKAAVHVVARERKVIITLSVEGKTRDDDL